ncbi:AI-2E family transporter [Paenirhodobacter populi]|uniref:AI-2E family transporter n=1 Tax=Paenirhodobacter populi TaxID=2306993 RepID=A0A443IRM0_9RHOB|nr:AI-2E family transporter [Sinirhodobacter populi]RWR09977.1 AI-2E family transporter [Sinirhodobacter populi]RWR20182.1 AI-2E family transporter [Sinirhodobacter populi]RWR30911.1 AI-2E family transporter [Sinirhodobacter populi]RWR33011.1 AI-2E family transporter [Sinirhodobacter populi]
MAKDTEEKREQTTSFNVLIVVVSLAFIWLIVPYYGAILWATILAILFHPLQVRLTVLFRGHRSIAAIVSVLACICIVVLPGSALLAALAQQATDLYNTINRREFDPATLLAQLRSALPVRLDQWLSSLDFTQFSDLQSRLTSFLETATQTIARRAYSVGQGTAQFAVATGVMLYLLFFLFRDGPAVAATIRRASPLSDHHTDRLLRAFVAVVKATVKGNLIIAVIQGGIGGLTFWALGVKASLFWGVLMTVLSLLPAVGAALVWLPVAIYMLVTGDFMRGIILMVIGFGVISLIDNLLRPTLVGKSTRLPDYVVLISTLGGLSILGVNGFVLGPLIAALFFAVWKLYINDRTARQNNLPG